jgi:hypothetical protein
MRLERQARRPSVALMVFIAVYVAAFGLLLAPKGTFVTVPTAAESGQ